jgi:hypothetical protein
LRHSTNYQVREEMLDRLLKEGLSPFMREVADAVEAVAPKLRLPEGAVRRVALQPVPPAQQCADCETINAMVENANTALTMACALAAVFPPAGELCVAAGLTYLTMITAAGACAALLAICQAYYNR